ncbi:hypothetical protein TYRP_009631 [Tyrophagus putrescentiae]|nr:hypothetical protein TYRP_009631 [Tyrophagus putrescentiae]
MLLVSQRMTSSSSSS